MSDPERIWLQSYEDTTAVGEDRLWCEDKVWPANDEDHEPTEYVRADRISQQDAELERLRREVDEAKEDADEWRSIDRGNAETISELRIKLAGARKAAFIEAAEIAEGPLYKEHYRGDENGNWTSYSDYGRGRFAAADAIRAKAEETRT